MVAPIIEKKNALMKQAISPHDRVSATLGFLASRMSYENLKYSTIISSQSLGKLKPESCDASYNVLHKDSMKAREVINTPATE